MSKKAVFREEIVDAAGGDPRQKTKPMPVHASRPAKAAIARTRRIEEQVKKSRAKGSTQSVADIVDEAYEESRKHERDLLEAKLKRLQAARATEKSLLKAALEAEEEEGEVSPDSEAERRDWAIAHDQERADLKQATWNQKQIVKAAHAAEEREKKLEAEFSADMSSFPMQTAAQKFKVGQKSMLIKACPRLRCWNASQKRVSIRLN